MKCPICKGEIEDDAKRCKHCGGYTPKHRSKWEWSKDKVQFLTYIAAIGVLLLMYRSDRTMQEQLKQQRESTEYRQQQFIEGMRPRIEIRTPEIEFTDTASVFYADFNNVGVADAEDLSIFFVLKAIDAPEDTLYADTARMAKLTRARGLTKKWSLPLTTRPNLTCFIKVRYTWTIQNLDYHNEKYYHFFYYKEQEKYGVYILDDAQVEDLWK